jgi:hypothetical protein
MAAAAGSDAHAAFRAALGALRSASSSSEASAEHVWDPEREEQVDSATAAAVVKLVEEGDVSGATLLLARTIPLVSGEPSVSPRARLSTWCVRAMLCVYFFFRAVASGR